MHFRAFLLFLGSFFTVYAGTSSSAQIDTVAVMEFEGRGLAIHESQTLTDKLRFELFKTGRYVVIEREQMQRILHEQGFQQSGCTSQSCAVEVGQLIGIRKMIAGSIGVVGRTYLVTARLIDVGTGQVTDFVEEQLKGDIDVLLSTGMGNVAHKLATGTDVAVNSPIMQRTTVSSDMELTDVVLEDALNRLITRDSTSLINVISPAKRLKSPIVSVISMNAVQDNRIAYSAKVQFQLNANRMKVIRTYAFDSKTNQWERASIEYIYP